MQKPSLATILYRTTTISDSLFKYEIQFLFYMTAYSKLPSKEILLIKRMEMSSNLYQL